MSSASPTHARPLRLNPFAFPSDTTFRFVLLIVAVLGVSLFIYENLFFRFNGVAYLQAFKQCTSASGADPLAPLDPADPLAALEPGNARAECMAPVQRWLASWKLGALALLAGVAGGLYFFFPVWQIRRKRLAPLSLEDDPDLIAYLGELCRAAGLSRQPQFVWDPLNTASGGLAFGRLGRYYVALTGGLVTQFYTDRPAFRAVVLHELAHIRNADIDRTYFTVAVWWAFVAIALIPLAAAMVGDSNYAYVWSVTWRTLALSALVYLNRNAILRAREMDADVRASVWDGPTGALRQILAARLEPAGGRWRGLLAVHPTPATRRLAIEFPDRLLRFGFWDAVGAGIAGTIAYVEVETLFWNLTGVTARSVFRPELIFGLLLVGVIGVGAWRAAFSALARGEAPRGAWRLGLGLGVGVLLGPALSFSNSLVGFSLMSFLGNSTMSLGLELFWDLLFLAGVVLLLWWIVAGATAWLEIAMTMRSPGFISAIGVAAAGAVLAGWLWLLFTAHDPFLALLAFDNMLLDALVAIGIYVVTQPLLLGLFVTLWAFPLAAWFWHGRSATAQGSSWAFLDPTPEPLRLLPQPPLRPRLALLAGLIGAVIYCALLLALRIGWRWGVPEAVRSTATAKLFFYYGQIGLAALLQAGTAVVVAGWVRRIGALHGLFAAFVGGCLMTIAILGLNLAFGGTIDSGFAWQTFLFTLNGGALLALPPGLVVAGLAGWVRRMRLASGRRRMADVILLHELLAGAPSVISGPAQTTERIVQDSTQ